VATAAAEAAWRGRGQGWGQDQGPGRGQLQGQAAADAVGVVEKSGAVFVVSMDASRDMSSAVDVVDTTRMRVVCPHPSPVSSVVEER